MITWFTVVKEELKIKSSKSPRVQPEGVRGAIEAIWNGLGTRTKDMIEGSVIESWES